jgi:hypothetical protein
MQSANQARGAGADKEHINFKNFARRRHERGFFFV